MWWTYWSFREYVSWQHYCWKGLFTERQMCIFHWLWHYSTFSFYTDEQFKWLWVLYDFNWWKFEHRHSDERDLLVNFWDNVVSKLCTCYLSSTFIGRARHQDLFKHFISALDSLDLKKLLQVSIDGPNVNWVFFSELCNYCIENDMRKWLDHAVSMLFMELSKQESRASIGNSKKFWEPCIKFCMTRQLGKMITLMWPEEVDSLFHFVAHSGLKMAGSSLSYWNLGWYMPAVHIVAVTAQKQVTIQSKVFNAAICNQRSAYLGKTTLLFLHGWYHETISYRIPVY